MSKKWIIAAGSGLAAAMLFVGAAGAVGTNGGFEAGSNPPAVNTFGTLFSGSTAIEDWTVSSGSVDWVGGGYWQPSEGSFSIDLNGATAGTIGQTFATVVGATYAVSFDLSGNPDQARTIIKTLNVSATGAAATSYSYDVGAKGATSNDMKWEDELYTFVATSNESTLSFTSTTGAPSGSWGPALDNVVITETLAKAADCKKDGWQTMFDSSNNTFKNQGDCVSFFATDGSNAGDGS